MAKWKATIECWPHSTGNGALKDQELAGERHQTFEFDAENMREALHHATLISDGMRTNPIVWQTPIRAIEFIRE